MLATMHKVNKNQMNNNKIHKITETQENKFNDTNNIIGQNLIKNQTICF